MRFWAAALVALLALAGCRSAANAKPDLYLMTSLPLVFDDGFRPGPAKGEAATFLRDHYRLRSIDLPSQLPKGSVLLAAQPRALPAEELVALDQWVRDGGRLLLLADPLLEWSGERPLSNRLRPPASFADTGLLQHWGLRLDAPDERGLHKNPSEMGNVDSLSPGKLIKLAGECLIDVSGISARCILGRGEVLVIADADWLNIASLRAAGGQPRENLVVLELQLSRLSETSK